MGSIDEQLPGYLGTAHLNPSENYQVERAVLAELRNEISVQDAVKLVGFAYGAPDDDGEASAHVGTAIDAVSDDWETGDQLRRRFAAAAVMDLLSQDDDGDAAVAATLASHAARLTNLKPVIPQLPDAAASSVVFLADARRRVDFARPSVQPFPPSKRAELPAEGDQPATSTELRNHVKEQRTAIRTASNNVDARLQQLELVSHRTSEEIDLLWWIKNPSSVHVATWKASGKATTLIAGLELARRLLIDPPPRGAEQVLSEALTDAGVDPAERVGIGKVVDETPGEVLADPLLSGTAGPWSVPILGALRQRRDGLDLPDRNRKATRLEWALQLVDDLSLKRIGGIAPDSVGRAADE